MNVDELTCEAAQETFGVLVLGAIDPIERERVEAHVFACDVCPAVLAQFSALPGLLRRLDGDRPDLGHPPDHVLDAALGQIRAAQRQHRAPRVRPALGLLAAVAAAAVLVAVIGVAGALRTDDVPVAVPASVAATDPVSRVSAALTLDAADSGTDLRLVVNGVEPGAYCEIVVVGTDGVSHVAAGWTAGYVGQAEVRAETTLSPQEIARVDVTLPPTTVLVSLPVAT